MSFINATPHELNIIREDGSVLTLSPSGHAVRVGTDRILKGTRDGVQFFEVAYGAVDFDGLDLDQVFDNRVVVVISALALAALPLTYATHFASPGDLVRNDEGQPIGCKGLTIKS